MVLWDIPDFVEGRASAHIFFSMACRAHTASHVPRCYSLLRAAKTMAKMTSISKEEWKCCHLLLLLLHALGWNPCIHSQGIALCTGSQAWDSAALSFLCGGKRDKRDEACSYSFLAPRRAFSSPLTAHVHAMMPRYQHLVEGAGSRDLRLVGHIEGGVEEESKTGRGDRDGMGMGERQQVGRGESGKWIEMS